CQSNCKAAEAHPKEWQRHIPAEMQSNRQPQIMGAHYREAEQNAETDGIDHTESGSARIIRMQQAEQDADSRDRDPCSVPADQILQGEAAERDFFSGRAAE